MSVFIGTFVMVFQAEREQFYSRISAGNQLYQDLITSHVPETNNSLKELSVRVRNETCKSSNLQPVINEKLGLARQTKHFSHVLHCKQAIRRFYARLRNTSITILT